MDRAALVGEEESYYNFVIANNYQPASSGSTSDTDTRGLGV